MGFGQIKNKFLEALCVTVLKNQNIKRKILSPFFMSVTLPEQQTPRNLRAWYRSVNRNNAKAITHMSRYCLLSEKHSLQQMQIWYLSLMFSLTKYMFGLTKKTQIVAIFFHYYMNICYFSWYYPNPVYYHKINKQSNICVCLFKSVNIF